MKKMQIRGKRVYGTFILEAMKLSARIMDVEIKCEKRKVRYKPD